MSHTSNLQNLLFSYESRLPAFKACSQEFLITFCLLLVNLSLGPSLQVGFPPAAHTCTKNKYFKRQLQVLFPYISLISHANPFGFTFSQNVWDAALLLKHCKSYFRKVLIISLVFPWCSQGPSKHYVSHKIILQWLLPDASHAPPLGVGCQDSCKFNAPWAAHRPSWGVNLHQSAPLPLKKRMDIHDMAQLKAVKNLNTYQGLAESRFWTNV